MAFQQNAGVLGAIKAGTADWWKRAPVLTDRADVEGQVLSVWYAGASTEPSDQNLKDPADLLQAGQLQWNTWRDNLVAYYAANPQAQNAALAPLVRSQDFATMRAQGFNPNRVNILEAAVNRFPVGGSSVVSSFSSLPTGAKVGLGLGFAYVVSKLLGGNTRRSY